MSKTLIFFLVLICNLKVFSSEIIDDYGKPSSIILGKRLTPFWSQEYSGMDLVKDELREITFKRNVPVAVFDSGFFKEHINVPEDAIVDPFIIGRRAIGISHGTSVVNLISGKGPYSASEVVRFIALIKITPSFLYEIALNDFAENNNYPKLISNSSGWPTEDIADIAVRADNKGIIWVLASAYRHETLRSYESEAPVVIVGSFAPSGLMSASAKDFKNIAIFSPADKFQATIDSNGRHSLFGESSGATPLVTGALANVISMIPDLTRIEAKTLLKESAYPTLGQYISGVSKVGLLNGYKLFRVAKRIALECGYDDEDITDIDRLCKEKRIDKSDTYKFNSNEHVIDNLVKKFPVCSLDQNYVEDHFTSLEKKEVLIAARKEAALNASNIKLLESLSCVYNSIGYEKNGEFFHHLSLIQTNFFERIEEMKIEAGKANESNQIDLSYLRYSHLY